MWSAGAEQDRDRWSDRENEEGERRSKVRSRGWEDDWVRRDREQRMGWQNEEEGKFADKKCGRQIKGAWGRRSVQLFVCVFSVIIWFLVKPPQSLQLITETWSVDKMSMFADLHHITLYRGFSGHRSSQWSYAEIPFSYYHILQHAL